jgi:hypothetical protein
MVLNSLPMLQPSEIIDANALIVALRQQSTLPIELQTEFHEIGNSLAADPNYIDRAIQRCIELVATHPPLQDTFQSTGNSLQANANHNRKSKVDDYSGYTASSADNQEIFNRFRDELLLVGKQKSSVASSNPVSKLVNRLLGKK